LPILLQGASGTGKSYIAQLIYQYAYCTEKIKGKFMQIAQWREKSHLL